MSDQQKENAEKSQKKDHPKKGQVASVDIFPLAEVFRDAQKVIDFEIKSVSELKSDCLVGLDANALLFPYELDRLSLNELGKIYGKLAASRQIVIPGQAVREFAKNKTKKLGEIFQYLSGQEARLGKFFDRKIGLLEDEDVYKQAREQAAKMDEEAKVLKKYVSDLKKKISDVKYDPVADLYRKHFGGCVVDLDTSQPGAHDEFYKEMLERYSREQPPGYKDKEKTDGGSGDLIIWKTLLNCAKQRDKDIIFVSYDSKSGWWVAQNGPFRPRYELIDEFQQYTGGRTIHFMSISELIQTFDGDNKVVEAVSAVEKTDYEARVMGESDALRLIEAAQRPLELDLPPQSAEEAHLKNLVKHKQAELAAARRAFTELGDDLNTSASLPLNRHRMFMMRRSESIEQELRALLYRLESVMRSAGNSP